MIGPPINREIPQLLPYPSSTTLQSNGDTYSVSFMTSPSVDSLMEIPNDIDIIDQATTAYMGALRRQLLALGRMQRALRNQRYATAIHR